MNPMYGDILSRRDGARQIGTNQDAAELGVVDS